LPVVGHGWPRQIVTIGLIIVAAFLLDWLVVLPVDKLRTRFGTHRRIDPHARWRNLSTSSSAGAVGR
jgi:hypothetical protein